MRAGSTLWHHQWCQNQETYIMSTSYMWDVRQYRAVISQWEGQVNIKKGIYDDIAYSVQPIKQWNNDEVRTQGRLWTTRITAPLSASYGPSTVSIWGLPNKSGKMQSFSLSDSLSDPFSILAFGKIQHWYSEIFSCNLTLVLTVVQHERIVEII